MSFKVIANQFKRTLTILNSFRKIKLKEYPLTEDHFITTRELKDIIRMKIEENKNLIKNLLESLTAEIEIRKNTTKRYRGLVKINSEYDFILNNKEMEDNYESTKIYQQKYEEQKKIYEELTNIYFTIDDKFLVDSPNQSDIEEEVVQILNRKIKSENITDEKFSYLNRLYNYLKN